jgi:hypothetical protein
MAVRMQEPAGREQNLVVSQMGHLYWASLCRLCWTRGYQILTSSSLIACLIPSPTIACDWPKNKSSCAPWSQICDVCGLTNPHRCSSHSSGNRSRSHGKTAPASNQGTQLQRQERAVAEKQAEVKASVSALTEKTESLRMKLIEASATAVVSAGRYSALMPET